MEEGRKLDWKTEAYFLLSFSKLLSQMYAAIRLIQFSKTSLCLPLASYVAVVSTSRVKQDLSSESSTHTFTSEKEAGEHSCATIITFAL